METLSVRDQKGCSVVLTNFQVSILSMIDRLFMFTEKEQVITPDDVATYVFNTYGRPTVEQAEACRRAIDEMMFLIFEKTDISIFPCGLKTISTVQGTLVAALKMEFDDEEHTVRYLIYAGSNLSMDLKRISNISEME